MSAAAGIVTGEIPHGIGMRRFAVLEKFKRWSRKPADSEPAAESLPATDTIQEDDDVSRFMQADVPEDVRQAALRELFHKPKFNRRDGLDDYDEDYRLAHTGSRVGPKRQA